MNGFIDCDSLGHLHFLRAHLNIGGCFHDFFSARVFILETAAHVFEFCWLLAPRFNLAQIVGVSFGGVCVRLRAVFYVEVE